MGDVENEQQLKDEEFEKATKGSLEWINSHLMVIDEYGRHNVVTSLGNVLKDICDETCGGTLPCEYCSVRLWLRDLEKLRDDYKKECDRIDEERKNVLTSRAGCDNIPAHDNAQSNLPAPGEA